MLSKCGTCGRMCLRSSGVVKGGVQEALEERLEVFKMQCRI